MQLNAPHRYRTATEIDAVAELLDLRGARVLELGCGAAHTTRALVERLGAAEVVATEVDRIQHDKNLAITDLPQVRFVLGGAEAIAATDASFDAVCMFKSLHHVPVDTMDRALAEIHRVLKAGGAALFSEPVYWGAFNTLMSLIHDEQSVRQAAFEALRRAVDAGRFRSEAEVFIEVPGTYPDWASFAGRFLDVTHTELNLDATRRAEIRTAFEAHMTPTGAHFVKPHRLDLLRKV
ncbi:class I SAM-dependent methyltransferase [uncultured Thiohalocapsa sp.]|uniref:class I SAM-dependent methyltransferase n=1 Tax=uncultured Thiohalocapsa sp. TaxID=768990 RepID=UPI0025E188AE|nr:class I SAM-dependent methyltransferase [uncultured Thiohalocapsa sp.]